MGGKPQTSTSADQRLKVNNPNAGKPSTATNKPAVTPGVHQEKFNQERQRQKDGGVTTDVKQS